MIYVQTIILKYVEAAYTVQLMKQCKVIYIKEYRYTSGALLVGGVALLVFLGFAYLYYSYFIKDSIKETKDK